MRSLIAVVILLTLPLAGCTKHSASLNDPPASFTYPAGTPPDPGSAGKATIDGIDQDSNGVRDDVQRWILARHPGKPKVQKALFLLARNIGQSLKSPQGEALRKLDHDGFIASDCLDRALGTNPWETPSLDEEELLVAKYLNTSARSHAYLENYRDIRHADRIPLQASDLKEENCAF